VRVLSPVDPELTSAESGVLFADALPVPFERRVTETLMIASRKTADAAAEAGATGNLEPFQRAVDAGVSANLCQAYADLFVDRPYSALEVSVTWSGNRRPPANSIAPVRFTRETAPVLLAASRELKALAPRDAFDLEGYVVALAGDNVREEGGTVTVAAEVDGGTRRVRVALPSADYRTAIAAHSGTSRIKCTGLLVKRGRQYELESPHDFALLGDE